MAYEKWELLGRDVRRLHKRVRARNRQKAYYVAMLREKKLSRNAAFWYRARIQQLETENQEDRKTALLLLQLPPQKPSTDGKEFFPKRQLRQLDNDIAKNKAQIAYEEARLKSGQLNWKQAIWARILIDCLRKENDEDRQTARVLIEQNRRGTEPRVDLSAETADPNGLEESL
jgi:hypothetical protein